MIPAFIVTFFRERRWPEIRLYCTHRENREGPSRLLRNQKKVARIREAFEQIFKRPPYPVYVNNVRHWDQQIAKYAERLGVAALIDDMKKAKAEGKPIASIMYFIARKDAACRWETLLNDRILADAQRAAKQAKADTAGAAESVKAYNAALAGLFGAIGHKAEQKKAPDWVEKARARHRELLEIGGCLQPAEKREILAIESRLHNAGFEVE